jgi:phenylacetate-CoA ligase
VHDDLLPTSGATRLKWQLRKFASGKETLHCAVLTPAKMAEFRRRLLQFEPDVLYGYPDAMSHFARFLLDEHLPAPQVRSVICTAEKLTDRNRELLESVFGGEVFNLYCTREHGCIGFECARHKGFHVDIGSLWLEIVKKGVSVPRGESGEIVITDFNNMAMPFIRNRIGDYGRLAASACDCGCALPLLQQLEGRVTDTLYRADGSKIDGGLLTDVFIDTPEIKAMQIIQTHIDRVVLNLIISDQYSEENERKALAELQPMLGSGMRIEVKKVDEIPRNPISGKYQEVICRVRPPADHQPSGPVR